MTAITLVLFSIMTAPSAFAAREPKVDFVPGQYVVELSDSAKTLKTSAVAHELGGRLVERVRENMFVVQRATQEPASSALSALRANPLVLNADPNYIFSMTKTPNDTEFGKLWGLSNTGAIDSTGVRALKGVDIGAQKAWDHTTGSKDIVVAVIDTGIDFKIPDLADNAWVNKAEAQGVAGIDDDVNGFIDDVHGFNFVAGTGDSTDDNGHGSHCAGTIGARGGDARGIAGINWNVSLMAVKFLDANGSGTMANAIKAIDYASKNGARILSNSWGGGVFAQTLFDVIEQTHKAGQLFVAAAGNDGADNDSQPAYPASYKIDNIISVTAIDQRGSLASFANFGQTTVHLAAPGVGIYSTTPKGFEFLSGTSMATPHVAGAAALLLADNPHLTAAELKSRLLSSARPLHSLKGKMTTGGLLDVSLALTGGAPPMDPDDASLWKSSVTQTIASPHPYGDKVNKSFSVTIRGAARVAVHFSRFETENNYDTIKFFNKSGDLLGTMSGTHTGEFSPIAEGDTIVMKMTSDDSVNGYGFDVDSAAFEKSVRP